MNEIQELLDAIKNKLGILFQQWMFTDSLQLLNNYVEIRFMRRTLGGSKFQISIEEVADLYGQEYLKFKLEEILLEII